MEKNAYTAVKKPGKKKSAEALARPIAEIWILPGNPPTVFPPSLPLASNGSKHPAQVYWQAQDETKKYRITFPVSPFKKAGPFDTGTDGSTAVQKVNASASNGSFVYMVTQIGPPPTPGSFVAPGSGVIIEES